MPSSSASTRAAEHSSRDDGSASLEFLAAGLILLVPLIYLVTTLAQLEAASFAVVGASRHAARVFVESDSVPEARAAADRAIALALTDHGLAGAPVRVEIACSPTPDECLARQGRVRVRVAVDVPLPLLPRGLDVDLPGRITVDAEATEQVSRFWGAP